MSSTTGKINYARDVFGIHSLAAAVIFAIAYAALLPFYIYRAFKNPTYVLIILALFCAIRVTAFVIRATLAGSEGAAEDLNLCIGESVVYSVGFFGLLYSTYTLVLDRELISGHKSDNPFSIIATNRQFIRIALIAAVALGITGSTYASSTTQSSQNLGTTLRRVSAIIFLVVTAILGIHTLFLLHHFSSLGQSARDGTIRGMRVLAIIIVLLLVRQIYLTITVGKIQIEAEWYPLAALTELIAVLLFSVPGLVPDKREQFEAAQRTNAKDGEATQLT